MSKDALFSLADLSVTAASATPYEFEYMKDDGTGSGVFLQVIGGQSAAYVEKSNKMVNERRKRQADLASLTGDDFLPIEADIEFGHKLTAARLVGWRGIAETFTEDNALILVRSNAGLAKQIVTKSNTSSNFLPLKSKA